MASGSNAALAAGLIAALTAGSLFDWLGATGVLGAGSSAGTAAAAGGTATGLLLGVSSHNSACMVEAGTGSFFQATLATKANNKPVCASTDSGMAHTVRCVGTRIGL